MMPAKIIKQHEPCPSCKSSDAYCEYDDGHGYCFSCTKYFPPPNSKQEAFYSLTDPTNYSYEYLPLRGITKETMAFYDVKAKLDEEGKPIELGFRYPNDSYKIRSLAEKSFRTQGNISEAGLFGRNKFAAGGHKYVTITEGELDALSLYQVIRSPVVSVQSSSSSSRDCILDRTWINSFERVYLAFDGDRAGREAAAKVARLFDFNKIYDVKFTSRKDANEYLQHGEGEELRNIWHNAKRYLPETVVSSFHEFDKILQEAPKQGIPYPFRTLNDMTYGIRTGESVLITAQEGVGKTELMHAIEYQILRETDNDVNVAAIFLEEPKRRHLQALAGLHLKRPVHLPDSGISPDQLSSALQDAIGIDDRLHVYSHFGSGDPEDLLDTIRFLATARSCKYILLDHITMAVSGLAGEDERRALDHISTRLEMMVKELDFSLIFVSHVNDEGLTRGSRYISKVADMRIDLSRNVKSNDPKERNRTYLTVSKNRFCGKTGSAGELIFDPLTYTYSEDFGDEYQLLPVVDASPPIDPSPTPDREGSGEGSDTPAVHSESTVN